MKIIIADSNLERSASFKHGIQQKFQDATISSVYDITSLIRATDLKEHNLLLLESQLSGGGAFYALQRIRDRIPDRKIKSPIWIYGQKIVKIPFSFQTSANGETNDVIRAYTYDQLEQICTDLATLRI